MRVSGEVEAERGAAERVLALPAFGRARYAALSCLARWPTLGAGLLRCQPLLCCQLLDVADDAALANSVSLSHFLDHSFDLSDIGIVAHRGCCRGSTFYGHFAVIMSFWAC